MRSCFSNQELLLLLPHSIFAHTKSQTTYLNRDGAFLFSSFIWSEWAISGKFTIIPTIAILWLSKEQFDGHTSIKWESRYSTHRTLMTANYVYFHKFISVYSYNVVGKAEIARIILFNSTWIIVKYEYHGHRAEPNTVLYYSWYHLISV